MPENRAAEEGPKKLKWWKDWRGETVAIIASGPSTKKEDVALLKGRVKVLAIKASVDLCPWADVVYGCDAPWWISRQGLPKFGGLRLCYDKRALTQFPALLNGIEIPDKKLDRILIDEPGKIGSGGNSGFQAINIVVQFGARWILGIGFDAQDRSGVHWYGRNNWAMANNPDESNFIRWRRALEGAAADLGRLGIEFVNCSPISTINNFRRSSVEQTLKDWQL